MQSYGGMMAAVMLVFASAATADGRDRCNQALTAAGSAVMLPDPQLVTSPDHAEIFIDQLRDAGRALSTVVAHASAETKAALADDCLALLQGAPFTVQIEANPLYDPFVEQVERLTLPRLSKGRLRMLARDMLHNEVAPALRLLQP